MSKSEEHLALFSRWFEELWNKKNYAITRELVHPEFTAHGAGGQDIKQGPDGVAEMVRTWHGAFPDGRMTMDDIITEGEYSVIRMTFRGTHLGDFYGNPASGAKVKVTSIGIDRVVDGMITEGWGELNMLGLMQQIGVIPTPELEAGSNAESKQAVSSSPTSAVSAPYQPVYFMSQGSRCRGWLYTPSDLKPGEKAPAIIMANAMTATKEITLPAYAEQFVSAGFVVLLFDYRYWGESEGQPRNQLFPQEQLVDLQNGISWLAALPEVDAGRLGGWGISLGGSHMFHLAAFDRRLKAVVAVAAAVNSVDVWEQTMGTELLTQVLGQVADDRNMRLTSGEPATHIPAWGNPGELCAFPQPEAYEYYRKVQEQGASRYENLVTVESIAKLVEYNPEFALRIAPPTAVMMIHATEDIIPLDLVKKAYEQSSDPKELLVLEGKHTDLYNKDPWFAQVTAESLAWFEKYLKRSQS